MQDSLFEFKSSGIGLCVTRGLVRHMGGNVYVRSVEGVGSQFAFSGVFRVVDENFVFPPCDEPPVLNEQFQPALVFSDSNEAWKELP